MKRNFIGFWGWLVQQNWKASLFILMVFGLGLAAGTLGVQTLEAGEYRELNVLLDSFVKQAGLIEVDTSIALKQNLYNDILLMLALYVLGLTVFGIPVMLGIIFTRGFVMGFTFESLASTKGVQGIALACAAILPKNILLTPVLLMAGIASLTFSILLARRFFNSKVAVWPSFVAYSIFMLVITGIAAGAGLLEVYLAPVLVRLAASYIF